MVIIIIITIIIIIINIIIIDIINTVPGLDFVYTDVVRTCPERRSTDRRLLRLVITSQTPLRHITLRGQKESSHLHLLIGALPTILSQSPLPPSMAITTYKLILNLMVEFYIKGMVHYK